jgi:anti-sigma factor RsiW
VSARNELHLTDEQLDDYADGEMDGAARASADAHLATCARCRLRAGRDARAARDGDARACGVTAPPELWPLVASSTIHLAAMRRQVLSSMRGVLLAGAITLVAATAVVTWKVARWTAARDVPATTAPVRAGRAGTPRRASDDTEAADAAASADAPGRASTVRSLPPTRDALRSSRASRTPPVRGKGSAHLL